jgi:cell wall-associated NlpC family hydrolase
VPVDRGALRPGDLAVWDGHVAMIVGNGMVIETGCQLGVQNDRRYRIASTHAI